MVDRTSSASTRPSAPATVTTSGGAGDGMRARICDCAALTESMAALYRAIRACAMC
jgi:hypothetical protein